jgi:hypothetical protein
MSKKKHNSCHKEILNAVLIVWIIINACAFLFGAVQTDYRECAGYSHLTFLFPGFKLGCISAKRIDKHE